MYKMIIKIKMIFNFHRIIIIILTKYIDKYNNNIGIICLHR